MSKKEILPKTIEELIDKYAYWTQTEDAYGYDNPKLYYGHYSNIAEMCEIAFQMGRKSVKFWRK